MRTRIWGAAFSAGLDTVFSAAGFSAVFCAAGFSAVFCAAARAPLGPVGLSVTCSPAV